MNIYECANMSKYIKDTHKTKNIHANITVLWYSVQCFYFQNEIEEMEELKPHI